MIQNSKHIRLQQTTGQSTRDGMSQKAITEKIAEKQDTLVSGQNIKTVNGNNITGSGDVIIASTGAAVVQSTGASETDVMSQKAVSYPYIIKNHLNGGNMEGTTLPIIKSDVGSANLVSELSANTSSPISGTKDVILSVTNIGSLFSRPEITHNYSTNIVNGNKYYLHFKYKVNSGIPILYGIGSQLTTKVLNKKFYNSGSYSAIFNGVNNYSGTLFFDGRTLWEMQIDDLMIIDLTFAFGVGNEPTSDQMDILIGMVGYFDGTKYISRNTATAWTVKLASKSDLIIQELLNQGGYVELMPKQYDVSATISQFIRNNSHYKGVYGSTIIKISGNFNLVELGAGHNNIIFENITFDGSTYTNSTIMSVNDIKAQIGLGSNNCFIINGQAKNIFFKNCRFVNWNGFAIKATFTQAVYYDNMQFDNCQFINNYGGIMLGERAEYHQIIGCTFAYNKIGCWIDGGNNLGTLNHFNANGVGLVLTGISGNNDTHGSIGNSTMNHNLSYSLFAFNVTNGYTLTGCHFFQGDIYIDNSKGISITSGEIATGIQCANENAGYNIIANNIFFKTFGGGNISGSHSKLVLFGNRFIDGSNSESINNII